MLQWFKTIANNAYPYGSGQDFWLGIVVGSILINLLALLFPITLMQTYDHFIPNNDYAGLLTMVVVLVIAIVLENILRYAQQTIIAWNEARLTLHENLSGLTKLTQANLHSLKHNDTIKLPDVTRLSNLATNSFAAINRFFLIIYFALLSYLNLTLTLIPLIALIVLYCLRKAFKNPTDNSNTIQHFIYQCLLIGHDNISLLLHKFRQLSKNHLIDDYHRQLNHFNFLSLTTFIFLLALLTSACLGTYLILNNALSNGTLVACLIITLQIMLLVNRTLAINTTKKSDDTLKISENSNSTSTQMVTSQHYANCIQPLLSASNIKTVDANMLAIYQENTTLYDIKNLMQQLQYDTISLQLNLNMVDSHLLPGLFVTDKNHVYVLLKKHKGYIQAFDAKANQLVELSDLTTTGHFHFFKEKKQYEQKIAKKHWFLSALSTVSNQFWFLIAINFINNLLVLSLPLFIVVLYDHIIQKQALSMLVDFSIGTFLAVTSLFLLQWRGAQFISLFNSKLLNKLHLEAFKQFIQQQKQTDNIQDYSAELQDFINIKNFFNGSLSANLLRLPFAIFAFIMLVLFANKLYIIVLVSILLLLILSYIFNFKITRYIIALQYCEVEQQKFVLDASINSTLASNTQQFKTLSANKIMANYQLIKLQQLFNTLANTIQMLCLVLVLGFGCLEIFHGTLSPGGLFACLLLTWLILYPCRLVISEFINLARFKLTWQRFNRLFSEKVSE